MNSDSGRFLTYITRHAFNVYRLIDAALINFFHDKIENVAPGPRCAAKG